MGVYPSVYKKKEFVEFLKEKNISNTIIEKFKHLPEKIIRNGNTYTQYICTIWYSIGNTFYNFELTYYCEEKIEFLFSFKVFTDVEISINNLVYELTNANIIRK